MLSIGILLEMAASHRVELKRDLQFLEMGPAPQKWRIRVGQAPGQALQKLQMVVLMSRPWQAEHVCCTATTWAGTHARGGGGP